MAAFDRAARRHRGDGGVVSRARGNGSAMRLARRARNILRRNGIEVSRYFAELDWERNFLRQLQSHRVSAVLDVGANSGQYARGLRGAGFAGRIVSFEPLPGPLPSCSAAPPRTRCGNAGAVRWAMSMEPSRSTSPATRAPAVPSCRC